MSEAHQLVDELRSRYHLPAYLHSQQFDFSDSVEGIGINPDRTPKRMRYDKAGVFEEYAVLIGNFQSVDDPDLQKTLKKIKYARPNCLTNNSEKTTRRFAGLRDLYSRVNGDQDKKRKGPLGTAFATPNPLIPDEFFAPKGADSFVIKMNDGVEHSLLDCPGKYSVRIATFRGNVIIDQQKVAEIEQGGRMKSRLEEAALKAHKMTPSPAETRCRSLRVSRSPRELRDGRQFRMGRTSAAGRHAGNESGNRCLDSALLSESPAAYRKRGPGTRRTAAQVDRRHSLRRATLACGSTQAIDRHRLRKTKMKDSTHRTIPRDFRSPRRWTNFSWKLPGPSNHHQTDSPPHMNLSPSHLRAVHENRSRHLRCAWVSSFDGSRAGGGCGRAPLQTGQSVSNRLSIAIELATRNLIPLLTPTRNAP